MARLVVRAGDRRPWLARGWLARGWPAPRWRGVLGVAVAAGLVSGPLPASGGPALPASGGPVPGAAWSIERTPQALVANGELTADACFGPSRCIAVGSSASAVGRSGLAEAQAGGRWRVLATAKVAGATHVVLRAVSCGSASACVAVGSDTDGSGRQVTLAEAWNGRSWTVEPTPGPAGADRSVLLGVSCASAASCVAVGGYSVPGGAGQRLAERWTGTRWILLPNPRLDSSGSVLDAVSCRSATACTAVGGNEYNGAADPLAQRWNGHAWSIQPAPDPAKAIVATLYGVSCASADACTAVGDYVNGNGVGSMFAPALAEAWNGTHWAIQPTPDPATNDIASLQSVSCTAPSRCTAVGYYVPSSATGSDTLAEAWNGTGWAIQATPDPGGHDSLAGVSCRRPMACTAAGSYLLASGTPAALAETGTGAAWAVAAVPVPTGVEPSVLAGVSCGSAVSCVATGSYDTSGNTSRALAEGWNGASWSILAAAGVPRARHVVLAGVSCTAAAACIAVGYFYVDTGRAHPLAERWNGSTWTVQAIRSPPGTHGALSAVSCTSAAACTAVGSYATTAGTQSPLAERWNGRSWAAQAAVSPPGGYDPQLNGVSCRSATACTAVGVYTSDASLVPLAERWNGSAWTVQPTPAGIDGTLSSVSCPSATDCTAVGDSYSYPSGISVLAEAWNGSGWSTQPAPSPPGFASLYGVSCAAPADCAAVGGYEGSSGTDLTLAEAWNGTRWAIQPTPNPAHGRYDSVLRAVCTRPGGYTAVGVHADAAGVALTLAEAADWGA
jgi:hypothetical protein